jgi:hypothetical protein
MNRSLVLATILLGACGPKGPAGPVSIRSTNVDEAGSPMSIDLSYLAADGRKVDIIMKLSNSGIAETNKLASEITIQGFDIEEGSLYWSGFVPPRQPQSFTAHLVIAEGFDHATAEITLRRSADSMVLLKEALEFNVGEDGKVVGVQ